MGQYARSIPIAALTALILAGGCNSARPAHDAWTGVDGGRGRHVVTPSLVTLGEIDSAALLADSSHGWEFNRNDPPPAWRGTPDRTESMYIEVRHREHLRTTNGRPREHTVTRTQSILREGQRR